LEDVFLKTKVLGDTFDPGYGEEYTIIDNAGPSSIIGQFNGLSQGARFVQRGWEWGINYFGGVGNNDVVLTSYGQAIPEPSSLSLIGLVIGGILMRRKMRWSS
jgi:hypothetical protein